MLTSSLEDSLNLSPDDVFSVFFPPAWAPPLEGELRTSHTGSKEVGGCQGCEEDGAQASPPSSEMACSLRHLSVLKAAGLPLSRWVGHPL